MCYVIKYMNLNKAMIIGNITRDPEVRTTPSGQTVANFSVATNLIWTDQSGQRQDKAEFHNVVMWRKLAEIAGQYLKKGSKVYVEGRLQTRSWDDQNGVKRYRTEIIADNMIMLDRPDSSSAVAASPKETYAQPANANNFSQTPASSAGINSDVNNNAANNSEEINVEDIPF